MRNVLRFTVFLLLLLSVTISNGIIEPGRPSAAEQVISGVTTGSITGTVTSSTDTPLPNIWIDVFDTSGAFLDSAQTDAGGNYSVGGLPAGNHKIRFDGVGYVSEWYNNRPSISTADLVAVVAGGTTAGIDAQLAMGGNIAGTVTDSTGAPLPNIAVYIFDSNNINQGAATTDASGTYSIDSLLADSYKIRFDGGGVYVTEYYDDHLSYINADPVAVVAGGTTSNINAQLTMGGNIAGTVTDSTGAPLPNIRVSIQDSSNGSLLGTAQTDTSGTYSVGGLPAGDYKVMFNGGVYISEWYDNHPLSSFNNADPVAVVAGGTTSGINAQLTMGGNIAGTVTDSTGAPLPNIRVSVYDANNYWRASATTDASGTYSAGGLPTDDYKVLFNGGVYVSKWYNNRPIYDFNKADPVAVVAGGTTSGINARLTMGGSIAGTVTDNSGAPLANIYVFFSNINNSQIGIAMTDAGGNYSTSGLPAGDYKVMFFDSSSVYGSEWYNNHPSIGNTNLVPVVAGGTTSNINARLGYADTIAPRTKVRAPRYSTNVSRIRRFRVYWKAVDPSPTFGIASYDVQYKVGKGGGWRDWLMNTKKKSSNFKGREGRSYYFRARARDYYGNVGKYSKPRRTIVPHDNNHLIRSMTGFGHIFRKSGSRYYLGTVRYSTNAGDAVTYRFRGNRVAVISTKARNRSKAKIYVDGKYKRTVKTAIRRTKFRRAIYRQKFRKISRHTITIVNVGDRDRLDLDGLAVGR